MQHRSDQRSHPPPVPFNTHLAPAGEPVISYPCRAIPPNLSARRRELDPGDVRRVSTSS